MVSLVTRLWRLRNNDHAIAAHVRAVLVDSLYASPRSLIIGALTSSGIALVVAGNSQDPLLAIGSVAIGGVAVARIVGVLRQVRVRERESDSQAERAQTREAFYGLGAYCYSALLGLFGLLTLVRTDREVLHLLSVTTAIGYAAGIAGRNAGRPWIALLQLCLASLPLSVGLLVSAEPLKAVLAVVIVLFVVAMMEITLQTYETILKATIVTNENVALAEYHAAAARRDDLTGVANRVAFREHLERQLEQVNGTDAKLALHWLDLDRFKEINDSFGHLAGNALLVAIAQRLQAAYGDSGIVARLGGDEFAIVSTVASERDALKTGRKILDLVKEPVRHEDRHLRVNASLGMAIAPFGGTDIDTLLKNADLALYRAKGSGRGGSCLYEPLMDQKIERGRELAAELHGALERGEFQLLFQPIFDLAGQIVLSCEALLRWNNRRYGAVSPEEFVPIAEEYGLIVPIGSWVLREACRAACDWPDEVRVSVNLSPMQLQSASLPTVIMGALGTSGFAASRLELEVTESVLLADVQASLSALNGISRMNVRITLDDFGTGYSSLSYLTQFPFKTLKIDRVFVADLESNPASVAIVQTAVDLAAKLGMRTVAEGVETQAQLDQLRRTRCNAVQGYLLGRPMPASLVTTLLAGDALKAQARF